MTLIAQVVQWKNECLALSVFSMHIKIISWDIHIVTAMQFYMLLMQTIWYCNAVVEIMFQEYTTENATKSI